MTVEEMHEVPQEFVQEVKTDQDEVMVEPEVINTQLSSAQLNELISSGMIQAIDTSTITTLANSEPQYVQVYESVQSELPQQILQTEEPQTIVRDQSQLHQLLLEGGEVLTEEQVVEQQQVIQPIVEYVQLPDGTIQEVILE